MRIIAGTLRGRRLQAPPGLSTRPTSDRVREALFNIVASRVQGSRFLDLCAGSGAVGLEAISRGADRVVFVEQARRALEQIEDNVERCGVEDRARIVGKDAQAALRGLVAAGEVFDLVYMDPPYDAMLYRPLLRALGTGGLVTEDGTVVVETRSRDRLPAETGDLRHYRDMRYGDTTLAFYERV